MPSAIPNYTPYMPIIAYPTSLSHVNRQTNQLYEIVELKLGTSFGQQYLHRY